MQTPEAKTKATAVQNKAWANFTKQFLNADKNKFVTQVDFDEKRNATAEIFFKEGPGSLQSVFGSDSRYWSEKKLKKMHLV